MTFPVLPANGPSGYNLTNSLRFRASASAYLNRTTASTTNRQIFTWSSWIKIGDIASGSLLTPFCFGFNSTGATDVGTFFRIYLNQVSFSQTTNGATDYSLTTTQLFRDPSAWYHFVVAFDTTQATASNRIKLYVNGVQVTAFSTATYPSLNFNTSVNLSGGTPKIGAIDVDGAVAGQYFDGYLTEVNFIDGQALTPSSFGSTNAITGVWQPAKYTGTYGTNGFYLPFTNTTSTTTLGNDFSGNGNNWTTNNISLTPGATYDAMTDVPTLTSPTAANFAVLNPLNFNRPTILDGNIRVAGGDRFALSTIGMTSGQWYAEMTVITVGTETSCGIAKTDNSSSGKNYVGSTSDSYGYYAGNGNKYNNASASNYGATYTSGDVIGIAFDADAGTLVFYKNNTTQGTAFTGLTSGPYYFAVEGRSTGTANNVAINFGQRPFAYTPPSGFVALNTFNLPSSTIPAGNQYMAADVYTGNGSSQTRTLNFQPDFIWNKIRSQAYDHNLFDVIRGVDKRLISNLTTQELTITNALTAFNSNGYSVGSYVSINGSGESIVNWAWKAGGAGVTNTAGSITSTVSANTTSGFSVVTWTAGSGTQTIGHGLNVAPSMFIIKARDGVFGWWTYHVSLGSGQYLALNSTAAATALSWGGSPTSSVFTVNDNFTVSTYSYVAYCFAPIAGFSAFGSYTGNGSTDGPFIYTGFRPRWLMIKGAVGVTSNWLLQDSARDTYNPEVYLLNPNTSDAEPTSSAYAVDFTANGFKIRNATTAWNYSGATFIYAAFAENPFKNALAR